MVDTTPSAKSPRAIQRSPNLAAQVYDALCAQIADGTLRAGERIVLDRVAESLGVSHTPLREALGRLTHEGLIVAETSSRHRIVPLTPEYVHHTYFVRAALEGLAAELATPNMTVEALAELERIMLDVDSAIAAGKPDVFITSDTRLHDIILERAQNPVLTRELQGLKNHISFIRGYSLRRTGDHIRQGHGEHSRLVNCLKTGDASGARQIMETHIRNTSRRIIQMIEFDHVRSASEA